MFKLESVQLFDKMVNRINNETVSTLMRGQIPVQAPEQVQEAAPEETVQQQKLTTTHETIDDAGDPEARAAAQRDTRERTQQPIVKENLPGRNDPCPCGSGKKFKNCHGRGIV